VVTNISFFILSSVIPRASHIAFVVNQNWFDSSVPDPLNTRNFTEFAIFDGGRGGGDVDEGVCGGGEDGGGVGGWGIPGNPCFIT